MKSYFKKNQLMITALAIMIAIAGYLQFAENTSDNIKAANEVKEANADNVITEHYSASELKEQENSDLLEGILDLSEEDLLAMSGNPVEKDISSLDSDFDIVVEDYLEDGMEAVVGKTDKDELLEGPEAGEIPGEAVYTSAGALEILTDAKLLKEQTRARNKETLLDVIGNESLSAEQKQAAVDSMVAQTEVSEKETAAEILLAAKGFSDVVVSISGNGVDVVVNAISLSDAQRAQIEDIVKRKTGISPENIIISTVVRD